MAPSTGSTGSGTTTTALRSWMGGAKGVLQKAHRRLKKALQLPQRHSIANDDAIVGCLPEPDKPGQWPRKTSLGQSVSESQVCCLPRLKVLRMTSIYNFGSQIHLLTESGRYDGSQSIRTSQQVMQQPSQMAQLVEQLRHEEILSMYPCCLGYCLLHCDTSR